MYLNGKGWNGEFGLIRIKVGVLTFWMSLGFNGLGARIENDYKVLLGVNFMLTDELKRIESSIRIHSDWAHGLKRFENIETCFV